MACHYCGTKRQSVAYGRVSRRGGGSYNRAARKYTVSLCLPCLKELAAMEQPGHWLVGYAHYVLSSVRAEIASIEKRRQASQEAQASAFSKVVQNMKELQAREGTVK